MLFPFAVNAAICVALFNNIHHSFKNRSKEWKIFYKHYFVVMATLLVLDSTLGFILHRIPYYQVLKLSILGWISVPLSTGPHFIYNVYLKNIYKLFSGDIDAVVENLRSYVEKAKEKYYEVVNSTKKGEVEVGFSKPSALVVPKGADCDSSDADLSSIDLNDEKKKEDN